MLYDNESAVLTNCYKEKLLLDLDKKKGSSIYDWSQFDSFWILELLCRTNEIKTVKEYKVIDRI